MSSVIIKDIVEVLNSLEYELLDNIVSHVQTSKRLNCLCNHGHKCKLTYKKLVGGVGCTTCKVIKAFNAEGYNVDADWVYEDVLLNIPFTCPNGHRHSISWSSFKRGTRCGKCHGSSFSIEFKTNRIKNAFSTVGYTIADGWVYGHNHKNISFTCSVGHKHSISWHNFQRGRRCGKCYCKRYEEYTEKVLNHFGLVYKREYRVCGEYGNYRCDFYLYDYDFFLEIDEKHHKKQLDKDLSRQLDIEYVTGIRVMRVVAECKNQFKRDLVKLLMGWK